MRTCTGCGAPGQACASPPPDPTGRPARNRWWAARVLAVLVGVALAVAEASVTNAAHERTHRADVTARAAARVAAVGTCVPALAAGEAAFTAGTSAVATLAGTVVDAGPRAQPSMLAARVAAVHTAQAPARAGLERCAGSPYAPAPCVASARALAQAADAQEEQAATLAQIDAAAAARNPRAADLLADLTRQRQALVAVVAGVQDTACAQAG